MDEINKNKEIQALQEEILIVKKRQQRIEYILRWIILIPAAIIAGRIASSVISFLYEHFWLHNSAFDISVDTPIFGHWFVFYFKMFLLEWTSVVATLWTACHIAPMHKKLVFSVFTIWLIIGAYLTAYVGVSEYDVTLFHKILCYAIMSLGLFLGIGAYYYQLKEELQSKSNKSL